MYHMSSKTHLSAAPLVPKNGEEVKMKLQYLKLLIEDTLKHKGIIHSKMHCIKTKKNPASYHNLAI